MPPINFAQLVGSRLPGVAFITPFFDYIDEFSLAFGLNIAKQ
jgi:hypothetical protein